MPLSDCKAPPNKIFRWSPDSAALRAGVRSRAGRVGVMRAPPYFLLWCGEELDVADDLAVDRPLARD